MIGEAPICVICKHNFRPAEGKRRGHMCDAFPDGIPETIIIGPSVHKNIFPAQENEIVFELDKAKAKKYGVTVEDFVNEVEA